MDKQRKKELSREFKDRKREIGIISFKCRKTGETFLGVSTDIRADLNSNRFKLKMNAHPNKKLLQLWKTYGEDGFEIEVAETLDYDDINRDYVKELEDIREKLMSKDENIFKIWR